MSEYIKRLSRAITAMHGCDCSHLETARVHEMMDGKTVWQGNVEVFELTGHPEAKAAYGWGWKDDAGEVQWIAVLGKPPIESPRDAVQAAIASGKFR